MSTVQERIDQIKTQLIGTTLRRVLLVEGTDDVDAFRIFLDRKFPLWEQAWLLAPSGSKSDVIKMLKKEPGWLGVVDRDEWTSDEISEKQADCANLRVLPRFCLESYLIDPTELWAAFPDKQKAKIEGGEAAFRAQMLLSLSDWVRHAALWHGVRPLWRKLRQLGFPDSVLDNPPMPEDAALRSIFEQWHAALNADEILAGVHSLERRIDGEESTQLFAQWIHAKKFYPQVVHQTLNRLLGQKDAKDRRIAILRSRTVPADLDGLWRAMALQA